MFDPKDSQACADKALATDLLCWAESQTAAGTPVTVLLEEEREWLVAGLSEAIVAIRRGIDLPFGKLNIGDPALRVMLEVVLSEKSERKISAEGLHCVTGLDRATLANCIDTLADLDMVMQVPEKCDGRHLWIRLTARARQSMFELLLQAAEFVRPRGCGLPL